MRQVEGAKSKYSQAPCFWVGDHTLENNYIAEVLQDWEFWISYQAPQPRGPTPEDKPPLCLVLKPCAVLSHSVVSDSLWPHRLWPTMLLCPWGFSRQEYWSGLPCPPPGDLPHPEIEPLSLSLQVDSSQFEPPGKPLWRPAGLNFVRLKGWEKYTSLLKVTHKISHPLEPREKAIIWQEVWPDLPAGLKEFPGGTGGGWGSSSGAGLWCRHSWNFLPPDAGAKDSWAQRPGHTQQPVDASAGGHLTPSN